MDIRLLYFEQGVIMNLVCILNHENIIGKALLDKFLQVPNTDILIIKRPFPDKIDNDINYPELPSIFENDCNFECIIRERLKANNVFIFNSRLINEMDEVNINYADRIYADLNILFRSTKKLCSILVKEGKGGKFLFITINPSISHMSKFPISPIYDEAVHSLIRSLTKELKPFDLVFNGVCIEPIWELLNDDERKYYRKKMKLYAAKKNPIKLNELADFIKSITLADLSLTSGNIFYIAEGADQANF